MSVRVAVEDGVGILTLDDRERRNALSAETVAGIVAAVDGFEADPAVGAIVVTGAPPAFCAGAVLGDLADVGPDKLTAIYEGFLRIARSPLPTIAAVNGVATGAGLNLAMACDVRVVGERARLVARFLDLGLHPGGGSTWMLTRAVGHERALAVLLLGLEPRGAEIVELGLALRCVPDDELLADAVALAARAAAHPRALVERVKHSLGAVGGLTHPEAVAFELEAQIWSAGQPFARERLAAMRERVSGGGSR